MQPKNFALVRKPSSAVEKTAPRSRRILSGMSADALALANKTRPFTVVICGFNGGLDEYLHSYLIKNLSCHLDFYCFTYENEFAKFIFIDGKRYDLLFIFLNPEFYGSEEKTFGSSPKLIAVLRARFHKPIIIISNELKHRQGTRAGHVTCFANAPMRS